MFLKSATKKWEAVLVTGLLLWCAGLHAATAADTAPSFNIMVSISRIENTLQCIDDMMGGATESPTALLRLILQGTDWIDPARLIILGVKLEDPQPVAAAFIPILKPNSNFQALYKAKSGPDYYIVALPPQAPLVLSDTEIAQLAAAARTPAQKSLRVHLNPQALIKKKEAQIQGFLSNLETIPITPEQAQVGLSPKDLQNMAKALVEKGSQLESFEFGLDLTPALFTSSFEVRAAAQSELAPLFSQTCKTALLADYHPQGPITLRSCRYDTQGLMQFFESVFGKVYQQIGIDFERLSQMGTNFTGEMAGGLAYAQDKIEFELMMVLSQADSDGTFLEKTYLPWLMQLSGEISATIEKDTGHKIGPLYARTRDSKIAGYPVIGIKSSFPITSPQAGLAPPPGSMQTVEFEMRMTTVGNLLLAAGDDQRLEKLIATAKQMQEKPFQGPIVAFEIDMSSYLEMMQKTFPFSGPLPKLGKLSSTFELENGTARSTTVMQADDIKKLIAFFQKATASGLTPEPAPEPEIQKPMPPEEVALEAPAPPPAPEKAEEKNADYWCNKGALLATYGNDAQAVDYFKKALALDPDKSEAHFQIGVAYGEIGDYPQALAHLDRAIAIDPRAIYYYGRGRVYLLAGDKQKALSDFDTAAAKGNQDARNYLQQIEGSQ